MTARSGCVLLILGICHSSASAYPACRAQARGNSESPVPSAYGRDARFSGGPGRLPCSITPPGDNEVLIPRAAARIPGINGLDCSLGGRPPSGGPEWSASAAIAVWRVRARRNCALSTRRTRCLVSVRRAFLPEDWSQVDAARRGPRRRRGGDHTVPLIYIYIYIYIYIDERRPGRSVRRGGLPGRALHRAVSGRLANSKSLDRRLTVV